MSFIAVTFMTPFPFLRGLFGAEILEIYNVASAGIVIGIPILPLVTSMSEDAIRAVPLSLRQGAFALGGTRLETTTFVVVPAALSGLSARPPSLFFSGYELNGFLFSKQAL